MHIPGQGFGCVCLKMHRDSRNRLADIQGQYLKGGNQGSLKGKAGNYNCKPVISINYCVFVFPFCLVWHALQTSSRVPLVGSAVMVIGLQMLRAKLLQIVGTIVVSIF